ncbi:hypothetical protein BDA99DRAFT_528015 [Phascolomyces articulosus]|uniref:Uncharacterized protein n=1 Tax=Phascolomyces articulosus TaxID=60185 RepID=A0AAD5JMQ8_9FUNG|nr:hypothetical protein BDA99DRAFT_528015 [Phascolomyces articulosus]
MMCDTNWCTFCDVAIPHSDALYCSEDCLKKDTLYHSISRFSFPRYRSKSMIFRRSNIISLNSNGNGMPFGMVVAHQQQHQRTTSTIS